MGVQYSMADNGVNGVRRGSGAPLEDILGLETLDQATMPTFAELLTRLWKLKYKGSAIIHFAGGLPRYVVLQQETRIPLDTPK